jgi:hypothetical protein
LAYVDQRGKWARLDADRPGPAVASFQRPWVGSGHCCSPFPSLAHAPGETVERISISAETPGLHGRRVRCGDAAKSPSVLLSASSTLLLLSRLQGHLVRLNVLPSDSSHLTPPAIVASLGKVCPSLHLDGHTIPCPPGPLRGSHQRCMGPPTLMRCINRVFEPQPSVQSCAAACSCPHPTSIAVGALSHTPSLLSSSPCTGHCEHLRHGYEMVKALTPCNAQPTFFEWHVM